MLFFLLLFCWILLSCCICSFGDSIYLSNEKEQKISKKASDEWKQDFFEKRHQSMALPGRHTSKYGNFLCKYDGKDLSVTCIDGSVTTFHDFKLPRCEERFQKNFTCKPEDRQSLCYNFILKRDKENKQYFIVSVTLKLHAYANIFYQFYFQGLFYIQTHSIDKKSKMHINCWHLL